MADNAAKLNKRKRVLRGLIGSLLTFLLLITLILIVRYHIFDGIFASCNPDAPAAETAIPTAPPVMPEAGRLCVYTLDVGQGNAALVISPNGKTMLIDSGSPEYAGNVADFIRAVGVSRLDLVIGTHPHLDHIGAMSALLGEFPVGKYLMPEIPFDCIEEAPVEAMLSAKAIPWEYVWSGDTLAWDGDCTVTVLSPVLGCEYSETDANDRSLMLRIEFGERSILFTGDCTVHAEQLSMFHNDRALFSSDVLVVAHHGSTTGSSYGFLETVGAEIALISVGKDNPYGHPDFDILNRLRNVGSAVYRTDACGWIAVFMDDGGVSIRYGRE